MRHFNMASSERRPRFSGSYDLQQVIDEIFASDDDEDLERHFTFQGKGTVLPFFIARPMNTESVG